MAAAAPPESEHIIDAHFQEVLKVIVPVTVSWSNISYHVPLPKGSFHQGATDSAKQSLHILQNVSGRATAGEILMVMGPSGCGKTSMLDILADRIDWSRSGRNLSGTIIVNGRPRDQWFRRVSSYVPQEDSLLGSFTVRETLSFASQLYHEGDAASRASVVEAVIADMGLESCSNTRIGDIFFKGLSGGQIRRLSIGIELVKKPSLLFLDEPTSGLDSAAALEVMKHLRHLASLGHTIVTTIHQPSSEVWSLADNILLLSQGRMVYNGPMKELVGFLAQCGHECPTYTNPTDFALSLINTDFPNHADVNALVETYAKSAMFSERMGQLTKDEKELDGIEGIDSRYGTNPMTQFLVVSYRTFLDNMRNPGVYWIRLFMYTMLSFMCGTIFLDRAGSHISNTEKTGLLFYIAAFLIFMSVAVLPFFIQQRAVFVRERANGMYGGIPYVLAKFTQSLPGIFLIALISTALVVPVAGLHGFGIFLADLFIALIVSESFMQLISALVPQYIIGMAVGAGAFGMFMLTEGFMIRKSNIPGWWIWAYYIGFHTYSFRVFMYNEFHGSDEGMQLLKLYDMDNVDVGRDLGILFAFAVLFQILFTYILYTKHTGRR